MAFKNIDLVLRAPVGILRADLAAAAAEVREFAAVAYGEAAKGSKGMELIAHGAVVAGAAITGAFAASVFEAASFDTKMRQSAIVSDYVAAHYKQVSDQVRGLAVGAPQSANSLADALAKILKGGKDAADAMTILRQSQALATAENANMTQATTPVVNILNSYGLSADHAGAVSNVLFKTIQAGRTDIDTVTDSFSKLVPMAASLGVPLQDVAAGTVAISRATGDFGSAGMVMTRLIAQIVKDTPAVAAVMNDAFGQSGADALRSHGLQPVIQAIIDATHGQGKALHELFPDVRTYTGIVALAADQGRQFAGAQQEMSKAATGTKEVQAAAAVQAATLHNRLEELKNTLIATAIPIGNQVLPMFLALVHGIESGVEWFGRLPGPVREVLVALALFSGIGLLVGGTILSIAKKVEELRTALLALKATQLGETVGGIFGSLTGIGTGASMGEIIGSLAGIAGPAAIGAGAMYLVTRSFNEAKNAATQYAQAIIQSSPNTQVAIQRLEDRVVELKKKYDQAKSPGNLLSNWNIYDVLTKSDNANVALKKTQGVLDELKKSAAEGGDNGGPLDQLKSKLEAAGLKGKDLAAAMDAAKASIDGVNGASVAAKPNAGTFDILGSAFSAGEPTSSSTAAASGETEAQRQLKLRQAVLGVTQAEQQAEDAQRALNDLRNGGEAQKVATAERAYSDALDQATRARWSAIDAQQKLNDLEANAASGRSLDELKITQQRAELAKRDADRAVLAAGDKMKYAGNVGIPVEVQQTQDDYQKTLLDQKTAAYALEDATKAVQRAQGDQGTIARGVQSATLDLSAAQRGVATADDQVATSAKTVQDLYDGGAVRDMANAELALQSALLGVASAHQAVIDAQTKATAAANGNDPSKKPKETLAEYMAALNKSTGDADQWSKDLSTIATHGGEGVIAALMSMGDKGTAIVHEMADKALNDHGGFLDLATKMEQAGVKGSQAWANAMRDNLTAGKDAVGPITDATVTAIATELGLGEDQVRTIMSGMTGVIVGAIATVQQATGGTTTPVPTNAFGFSVDASGAVQYDASKDSTTAAASGRLPGSHNVPMALGGVDAHIVSKPTILYGERQTGAEAFIPKQGISQDRALGILNTAAGWYGAHVMPMAAGGIAIDKQIKAITDAYNQSEQRLRPLGTSGNQAALPAARAELSMAVAYLKMRQAATALASSALNAKDPSGAAMATSADIRSWFTQAIALTHVDSGWLDGLVALGKAESGLNPMAVNSTGVPNGRYGVEHAKGVMQMLPSTFAAHELAGHADIFNPIDNIASAIGYMEGRYGSVYNTPYFKGGPYKGYALGGIHVHDRPWDSGGVARPGWNAIYNATGHPENLRPAGGGVHMTITQTIHVAADADIGAVRRAVRDAIRPEIQTAINRLHAQVEATR